MRFYVSYFAQFRNMTAKQICFSTAKWDPKWFHDFQSQDHKFVKDGRIYGLRIDALNPINDSCRGMPCPDLPNSCEFLAAYKKQLDSLNFDQIIYACEEIASEIATELGVSDPEIVLLVYETPRNKCSERWTIKSWFARHGIKLEEWRKSE